MRDWDRDGRDNRDRRASPPPPSSDSYIPGRSPRRPRSRSIDRYRTLERTRESERWRPAERSRSRPRSPGMRHPGNGNEIRRSPPRRMSPRYVSPRRGGDDRGRILDRDHGRSPPRRDGPPLRDMRYAPTFVNQTQCTLLLLTGTQDGDLEPRTVALGTDLMGDARRLDSDLVRVHRIGPSVTTAWAGLCGAPPRQEILEILAASLCRLLGRVLCLGLTRPGEAQWAGSITTALGRRL